MTQQINESDLAHQKLVTLVLKESPNAKLYEHAPAKTSDEAMEARYQASGEKVPGAKALLIKLDVKEKPDAFAVIILPGFHRLDSKALKRELKQRVSGTRNFRFATPEEMAQIAPGIEPGKMPPFGRPLFPGIAYTFIDKSLLDHNKIGFNAAHFEKSFIMPTEEYLNLVTHDGIIACSEAS